MTQRIRFDIRQAGKRVALVLGLVAAVNLAFYVLYARPAVKAYQSLLASESAQALLDDRRGQVEKRESYLEGLEHAEEDLHFLRSEVLSTRAKRMVPVQAELDALARQFRIDADLVKISNEQLEDEELDRMVITVPLEGGYTALRKFLQAVEQSSKFLIVERVALAQGKQGGVMLQLNITLATYFIAPPELTRPKQQPARRSQGSRA